MIGMRKLVEVRSYRLKPGTGSDFHTLVAEQSAPLHAACSMDLVVFGPSPHDPDSYVLVRAYDDPAQREAAQAAFYASSAWRDGPRQAIVSLIVSDSTELFWLDQASIAQLREGRRYAAPAAGWNTAG